MNTETTWRGCMCESALCDHIDPDGLVHACTRPVDPRIRMDYVEHTCTQCAANMGATGGQDHLHLTEPETALYFVNVTAGDSAESRDRAAAIAFLAEQIEEHTKRDFPELVPAAYIVHADRCAEWLVEMAEREGRAQFEPFTANEPVEVVVAR